MRMAQQVTNQVQRDLRGLERTAKDLDSALGDVKMDESQAQETRRVVDGMRQAILGAKEEARSAKNDLRDVKMTAAQALETDAVADAEVRSIRRIRDAALEAAAAVSALRLTTGISSARAFGGGRMMYGPGGFSGVYRQALGPGPSREWLFARNFVPPGAPYQLGPGARELGPGAGAGSPFLPGAGIPSRGVPRELMPGPGPTRFLGEDLAQRLARAERRTMQGVFGAGDTETSSAASWLLRHGYSVEDLAAIEGGGSSGRRGSLGRGVEDLLGGGVLSGGARRGGFFGGGGGGRGAMSLGDWYSGRRGRGRYDVPGPNLLAGILPGGARARPAALFTLATAIGGLGPAAVPAAGGLAVGAGGVVTGLLGSMATLKLAFADMSAAAFTSKAAFDALTPAQQSLVISLKSLDAGVVHPLEQIAQENLIPKLTDALHTAVSPQLIGALKAGVGSFATGIGGGVQDIAKVVGSSGFAANLGDVLKANARYVEQFLGDIGMLTDAFIRLLRAGIPFTDWLSTGLQNLSKWIDLTVKTTAANGKLAQFFDHAKQGLQAFGGVVKSLVDVLAAFGNAFGFKNSIALFGLLQTVLENVANIFKMNKQFMQDFMHGLIQSAQDAIKALQPLAQLLSQVLSLVNRIANAIGGWRIVFDAALVLFAARLAIVVGGFKKLAAAETAAAAAQQTMNRSMAVGLAGSDLAVAKLSASVAGLKTLLLDLASKAFVITMVLSLVPGNKGGQAVLNQIGLGGLGNLPLVGHVAQQAADIANRYVRPLVGKAPIQAEQAPPGMTVPKGYLAGTYGYMPSTAKNPGGFATPAELRQRGFQPGTYGLAPSTADNPSGYLTIGEARQKIPSVGAAYKKQQFTKALALPAAIQNQIAAASAGHGNMEKANAAAYSYYNQLLKTPGLSQAQRTAIYNAQAPYTAPKPFQQTGGGSIGFSGPTSAGGAVFNAQQALSTAMASGSGVPFSKQVELAKAYEAAASKAYEHLKAQKIDIKDTAAKQAELTTLARDEANARKAISTILERQHKAMLQLATDTVNQAKANYSLAKQDGASHADMIKAGQQYLAVLIKQAAKLKDMVGSSKELAKIAVEEKKTRHDILTNQVQAQWERMLGIGTNNPQEVSAQRVRARERNTLLGIVKAISKVPHRVGTAQSDPYGAIPGAAHMSNDQLVKALVAHGVHFSNRALKDFDLIGKIIDEANKKNIKINSDVNQQIIALLKQISDNTKKTTLPSNYFAPSARNVGKALGLTGDVLKQFEINYSAGEIGKKIPGNLAINGIPVGIGAGKTGFHPYVPPPPYLRGYPNMPNNGITINGDVQITAPNARNAKELASEFQSAILKKTRSNAAQTRGPQAGKSAGMS